ncbi:MAG TPA: helix-turn-helix transcriptional regulator [Longimicrobiales bacterium]|nr:helix-turn-helix transcriptional regulator [Longimicrobiales bacterium]
MDSKAFHILLSLAAGPKHGYGIRQEVEERTAGEVRLWPASLYGTLAELSDARLIEEAASPGGADDDARRKYYALTGPGRSALRAEATRLERLARLARAHLSLGEAEA